MNESREEKLKGLPKQSPEEQLEAKFQGIKKLCDLFSTSAKPIGSGYSGLVVDMGDGTITKFFRFNFCDNEQRQILNEACLLEAFNGRVGEFRTPLLTSEPVILPIDHPLRRYGVAVGYLSMQKMEGSTLEWGQLSRTLTKEEWKEHLYQIGVLVASIHEATKNVHFDFSAELRSFPIYAAWIKDLEMRKIIDMCNEWFEKNQKCGFVHGDVVGRNIISVNSGRRIDGILDFSLSGIYSNQHFDFREINQEWVAPVVAGYESISGEKLELSLIEMSQLKRLAEVTQELSECLSKDKGKRQEEERQLENWKSIFEKRLKSLANDLALQ